MSEEINPQPTTSPENTNDQSNSPSVEEFQKSAQLELAKIAEYSESAKAAATAATESQNLAVLALADTHTKLAEITTAVTQALVAKAAMTETADSQKLAAIALADAQAKLIETATQAVAAKTQISDAQAVIATKSDHIQKAQEHADKVRADLDRSLTSATQQATEAEGLKSRAQSAADSAATLVADIRTAKGSVETDAATIVTARKVAEESASQTKGLADKSATVEARIAAYEKRLTELDALCAAQLKLIEEDLLPGATSAGLATAFDKRRQLFLKPQNRWQWVFVGSVVLIVILAVSGLWQAMHLAKTPEWDELLRLWLARLPIAGALVWLALHASREAAGGGLRLQGNGRLVPDGIPKADVGGRQGCGVQPVARQAPRQHSHDDCNSARPNLRQAQTNGLSNR